MPTTPLKTGVWIVALAASLVLGTGAGTTWWLLAGATPSGSDASSGAQQAPDDNAGAVDESLAPITGDEVFIGDELEALLLDQQSVGDASGADFQLDEVSRELYENFSGWPDTPECLAFEGTQAYIESKPAGYRSVAGDAGDGSRYEQMAFQFSTVQLASEAYGTFESAMSLCSSWFVEDGPVWSLTDSSDEPGVMPSISGVSQRSDASGSVVWSMVRVGNVLLYSTIENAEEPGPGTLDSVAAVTEAVRSQAPVAAATIGGDS
jgi:hypothetical protein